MYGINRTRQFGTTAALWREPQIRQIDARTSGFLTSSGTFSWYCETVVISAAYFIHEYWCLTFGA